MLGHLRTPRLIVGHCLQKFAPLIGRVKLAKLPAEIFIERVGHRLIEVGPDSAGVGEVEIFQHRPIRVIQRFVVHMLITLGHTFIVPAGSIAEKYRRPGVNSEPAATRQAAARMAA